MHLCMPSFMDLVLSFERNVGAMEHLSITNGVQVEQQESPFLLKNVSSCTT